MAKVINEYNGFTATDIYNRASNTCDMAVVGTTVEGTNVTTTKLGNVLGVASHAVGDLYTNAAVNHWSQFGPTVHTITASGSFANARIVNTIPSSYSMGDFVGYNHTAITPGWTATGEATATATIYIDPSLGTNVTFHAPMNAGEIDYSSSATACRLVMWNSDTSAIVGTSIWRALSDCLNTDVDYQVSIGSQTAGAHYNGAVYVTNDAAEDEDIASDGSTIISKIANSDHFHVDTVEMTDSGVTVIHNTNVGVNCTVTGLTFNLTAGTCGFSDASTPSSYGTGDGGIGIIAYLKDEAGTQIGSAVAFRNVHIDYVGGTSIGAKSGQPGGMTNLAAHGYHFEIVFTYIDFVPE